jgi:hypothetical protein
MNIPSNIQKNYNLHWERINLVMNSERRRKPKKTLYLSEFITKGSKNGA